MRIVIFFICLILAHRAFAATAVDAELSASRDDNVSRAQAAADIKSDNIAELGIDIKDTWLLTPSSGIVLHGKLAFEQYQHYDGLSNVTANAGADYRFQPVVSYSAPVFDIGATLERYSYNNSAMRDGTALQTDISATSRVTDRIKLRGGLGLERRWADEGDIYAWQRDRIYAGADYKVGSKATLYSNLSRSNGDQVFDSSPNPALFAESRAVASDPVFGALRAYRVDATAYVLDIGDSIAISGDAALDIGLRHFYITTGDDRYDGTELRVSWLYRFK